MSGKAATKSAMESGRASSVTSKKISAGQHHFDAGDIRPQLAVFSEERSVLRPYSGSTPRRQTADLCIDIKTDDPSLHGLLPIDIHRISLDSQTILSNIQNLVHLHSDLRSDRVKLNGAVKQSIVSMEYSFTPFALYCFENESSDSAPGRGFHARL
jgi:hypothetical protein